MIIFSIGRRCNTVEFLKKFKLYKGASPFDWHVISLETVIWFINNEFKNFTDDIYLPWVKKIINQKNFNDTNIPSVDDFKYLRINLRNHKNFGLNLNTVDINDIETDLYTSKKGLYYFHYDMSKNDIIQQQQRRIQRFLDTNINECLLLYIWTSLTVDKIDTTVNEIKNQIKLLNKPYKMLFVLPIECGDNALKKLVDENNLTIVTIKVPAWEVQSKKYYNENNLNNTQIKWRELYNFIKRHYKIS